MTRESTSYGNVARLGTVDSDNTREMCRIIVEEAADVVASGYTRLSTYAQLALLQLTGEQNRDTVATPTEEETSA